MARRTSESVVGDRTNPANATFTICGLTSTSKDLNIVLVPPPKDLDVERKRILALFGADATHYMICFHVEGEACIIQRPLSDLYYVWDVDDVNENHFCLHLHRFRNDGGAENNEGPRKEVAKVPRQKSARKQRRVSARNGTTEISSRRSAMAAKTAAKKERDEFGRFKPDGAKGVGGSQMLSVAQARGAKGSEGSESEVEVGDGDDDNGDDEKEELVDDEMFEDSEASERDETEEEEAADDGAFEAESEAEDTASSSEAEELSEPDGVSVNLGHLGQGLSFGRSS